MAQTLYQNRPTLSSYTIKSGAFKQIAERDVKECEVHHKKIAKLPPTILQQKSTEVCSVLHIHSMNTSNSKNVSWALAQLIYLISHTTDCRRVTKFKFQVNWLTNSTISNNHEKFHQSLHQTGHLTTSSSRLPCFPCYPSPTRCWWLRWQAYGITTPQHRATVSQSGTSSVARSYE